MQALSVSELTALIKAVLEDHFPEVVVRGELSNVKRASSGHVYLTIKDDGAQISGVMWRGSASKIKFDLDDGLAVLCTGRVEVYPPRGSYQLIIREVVPEGTGPLELAFRQLRTKLEAEGLFDPEHKRPLPHFPRKIALITSPTGAAVRDMLQVLTRRWPQADVIVLPVAVQGAAASGQIAQALDDVVSIGGVDVVLCGRGGGSLEDLWAFNEEETARAIFACPLPVVSAVGHETDLTIADLVADRRALTPTEAAELVTPDATELRAALEAAALRLAGRLRERVQSARMTLDAVAMRRAFTHPFDMLHQRSQQLDDLSARMGRSARHRLQLAARTLSATAAELDALSPLQTLARGYSITKQAETGDVVRSVDAVQTGDVIETLFADGRVTSEVREVDPTPPFDAAE